jgi:hypothetical protein
MKCLGCLNNTLKQLVPLRSDFFTMVREAYSLQLEIKYKYFWNNCSLYAVENNYRS